MYLLTDLKAVDEEAYRVKVATKENPMKYHGIAGDQMVKEHEQMAPPPGDLAHFLGEASVGKHSPAPWIVSNQGVISEITARKVLGDADWHVDDRDRALACVNFCEGVGEAYLQNGGLKPLQARLRYYEGAQNKWVDRSFMLQHVLWWMTEQNLEEWGSKVAQGLASFTATNQVSLCRYANWKDLIFPPFLREPFPLQGLAVAPGVDKKIVAEAELGRHHRESLGVLYSGKGIREKLCVVGREGMEGV